MRASRAVGRRKVHVRVRELIVGDDEVARVDEARPVRAVRGRRRRCSADSRSPKLAVMSSARGGQCRSRWMPCSVLRSSASSASTCVARAWPRRARRPSAVTADRWRRAICSNASSQAASPRSASRAHSSSWLVTPWKRRHHADHRLAPPRVEQNTGDVADRRRGGQRRSAELSTFTLCERSVGGTASHRECRRMFSSPFDLCLFVWIPFSRDPRATSSSTGAGRRY